MSDSLGRERKLLKVRDGINDWLDQHGCQSVEEIIGCMD